MDFSLVAIIFYILLIDSIGANLVAWGGGENWWNKHFHIISRYFPVAKGWTTYYLILVVFIGYLIFMM